MTKTRGFIFNMFNQIDEKDKKAKTTFPSVQDVIAKNASLRSLI